MGFTHLTPLGHMTGLMGFAWLRDMEQLTRSSQLINFTLRLTMCHESRDARG